MGFTPGMDAGTGAGREEESTPGREDALRVRWRGPEGHEAVTAELQLLAALEVAGISAAPDVLGIEEDGYVRETAAPLVRRGGRRAAQAAAPATGERLALARARDDLDALVDALHQRGWVLGAPRGRGLGVRADGSVLVLDLSGLRREESLVARSADRHWVDSVLRDEERTLRRRVHLAGETPGETPRETPEEDAASARSATVVAAGQRPAPSAQEKDLFALALAGPSADGAGPASDAADGEPGTPLPVPRLRRRRSGHESPSAPPAEDAASPRRRHHYSWDERATGRGRSGARRLVQGRVTTAVTTARTALGSPRPRRTVLLGGAAVLMLCVLGAAGIHLAGGEGSRPAAGAPALSDPATAQSEGRDADPAPDPAPAIEDPWALATELAGARHAYVTGAGDRAVALPGSAADAEDEEVREAYRDLEVTGGGPVVHEAELLAPPDTAGDAVVRAVTSTEEHEILLPGSTRDVVEQVPAGEPVTVDLSLHWDGHEWRIAAVERVA